MRRRILSADAEFQLALALLDNRKQRRRQQRFAVQTVTAVDAALAHDWPLDSVWTAAGRPLSDWARGVVERSPLHVELAPPLFAQLSGKDEPGELVAFAALPPDDLTRIAELDAPLL